MHIEVKCNDFVQVKDALSFQKVVASVVNYELNDTTLEGIVKIEGLYYSKDEESANDDGALTFEKQIPFSIVFLESDLAVEEVVVREFSFYEIVNRGIEVSFELAIDYFNKPSFIERSIEPVEAIDVQTETNDDNEETSSNCPTDNDSVIETMLPSREEIVDSETAIISVLDEIAAQEFEVSKSENEDYDLQIERIKEKAKDNVDILLKTKLEVKENLPTKTSILGRLRGDVSVISIDYHDRHN